MRWERIRKALCVVFVLLVTCVAAQGRESRAYGSDGGMGRTFPLIGGNYEIYAYAKVGVRSTYAGAAKSCVFGGNFQQADKPGNAIALGNGITIGPVIGYKLGPETVALPGGLYHLSIAAATNCSWHFIIQSAEDNGAGMAPVQIGTDTADDVQAVTLRDRVQFLAQYRTDHLKDVPVSGRMELIHGGKVVQTFPLKLGTDDATLASVAYQVVKWEPGDAKLVGQNVARFVLNINGREYVSTGEFEMKP